MLRSPQGLTRVFRGLRRRLALPLFLVAPVISTLLLAACVGGEPTATRVFTPLPSLTPTTAATPAPTDTPVPPTATPTMMPTPTLPPTPTSVPTREPTPTPAVSPNPTPTPSPTPTPTLSPTPTPTPVPQVHQPRELFLDVTSVEVTGAAGAQVLKITGRSSPDATVSVNGQLAAVDEAGAFGTPQPLKLDEGPNLVEVIASDLAGQVRSQVLAPIVDPVNKGLSGVVTGIASPAPGLTVITLDAGPEGVQRVEAVENTAVTVPGRRISSAADISPGDFLALTAKEEGGRLEAIRILVRPERPVVHAHFTGSKVGSSEDTVLLMDRHGNLITVAMPKGGNVLVSGQVVTAVLRQDLKTGGLSLLDSETADVRIARLGNALQTALVSGSPENQQNLKARLADATTGHLTTLNEVLFRADPGIRFVFSDALEAVRIRHLERLNGFGLGPPALVLTGVIQDVTAGGAAAFVSPHPGVQQQVNLTGNTRIVFFGEEGTPDQLDLGQRIMYLYDPVAGQAISVEVVFPSLGRDIIESLLPEAAIGELDGTISSVSTAPPRLVVQLALGTFLTLTVAPDTRVLVTERPGGLDDLVQGTPVKVRYDLSTFTALSVDTYDPSQAFLTGVLRSIIKKIRPGIRIPGSDDVGNISIVTPSGEVRTLNITDDTVIEREGLRMNIGAPKLGDLVRPTTRYDRATGNLHRLVLTPPTIRGTLRGKLTQPANRRTLTISTDELDLVTVKVTDRTRLVIRQPGGDVETGFDALELGARVVSGAYDPFTGEASLLVMQAPTSIRRTGAISAVDTEKGILKLESGGESIDLLIPNKPGVITINGAPRSIRDLKAGFKIIEVFYGPSGVVVRLDVTSP